MRTKRQETKEGILTGVHRKELSSFLCTPVSIPLSFLLRGIQESIGAVKRYQPSQPLSLYQQGIMAERKKIFYAFKKVSILF